MTMDNDTKSNRWRVCRLKRGLGKPTPIEALEQVLNGLPRNWEPHIVTTDDKGGIIVICRRIR